MVFELNKKFNYGKILFLLIIASVAFGISHSVLGLFSLPLATAFTAALFSVSFPKRHGAVILALICSGICAVNYFVGTVAFFCAVLSSVCGLVIGVDYVYKRNKTESVVTVVSVAIVLTLCALWLGAMKSIGTAQLSEIKNFYASGFAEFKTLLLENAERSLAASMPLEQLNVALSNAELYLDALALLLPSLLVVVVLMIMGCAFKIFTLLMRGLSADTSYLLGWRFTTSNVFVIFYIALSFINAFMTETNIFSVSVSNLYVIFNFIYAYIGFNFVTAMLSQRWRRGVAVVAVIGGVLLLSSLAVQFLAVAGAVFSFISNKTRGIPNGRGSKGDSNNSNNERGNDDEE